MSVWNVDDSDIDTGNEKVSEMVIEAADECVVILADRCASVYF